MGNTLDIFGGDAFSVASLTDIIRKMPFAPRFISNTLNLFEEKGVPTTNVWIEEIEGKIALLPYAPRGGVAAVGLKDKRKGRYLNIPHIPYNKAILAEQIQNVRAFGQETELEILATVVNDELQTMLEQHKTTLEYQRMGALTGKILDADGSTTFLDLYDAFGTSETTQDWNFDATSGTGEFVQSNALELNRIMDSALGGTPYEHIIVLCSAAFFKALLEDGNFQKVWNRPSDGAMLRDDLRSGVTMAGVTFIEYRGAAGVDGVAFIAADQARAFPIGVSGLYKTYFAPADMIDTVNTPGLPVYAMQEPLEGRKGIKILTQSNPLSLCLRPKCLVKITKT